MLKLKNCGPLALSVLFLSICAVSSAEDRFADVPPRPGHLVSADIRPGAPQLLAWESTDEHRSELIIDRPDAADRSWSFPGFLIKQARWGVPGETVVLSGLDVSAVTPEDDPHSGVGEDRLYRLEGDGSLSLVWSSRELEDRYGSLFFSPSARHWIGSRFSEAAAVVEVGRTGQEEPTGSWRLEADPEDPPRPFLVEQFSHVHLLDEGEPVIGILWAGRLWLADGGDPGVRRVEPPTGCQEIQRVEGTSEGLWVECYRATGAEPAHQWTLYPDALQPSGGLRPGLTERLDDPLFLDDGLILVLDRRRALATGYQVAAEGTELESLGTVDLPMAAKGHRLIPAGDVLLEDLGPQRGFRTIPLPAVLALLHASDP